MMIAEESTAYPGITAPTDAGGLGFGLKWNMGWMHDTLQYLHEEPINRKWHHNEITFSMVYAYSEHYVLPISHDEVVYGKGSLFGKMPGDDWQRYAGVRALFAYQWAHPGKSSPSWAMRWRSTANGIMTVRWIGMLSIGLTTVAYRSSSPT